MLYAHEPLLSFFILLLGRALPEVIVTAVTNNKMNTNSRLRRYHGGPRFLSTGREFVNACWLGKLMTFLFHTLPALTLMFIEFFRTNGFSVHINV
jgi:hypothetical protein